MKTPRAVLAVALATVTWSCDRAEPPVAELSVAPTSLELGYPEVRRLELRFEATAELSGQTGQPLVFVHVLDEPGSVLRTFDHPLPGPWRTGEIYEYEVELFQSALTPPLPPGRYPLSVGLYDTSGRRWALSTTAEEVDRYEYAAAQVEVPDEPGDAPMFYFSPSWRPIEGGADLQILARRWLDGSGTIRLDPPAAGVVWMLLRIPEPGENQELVVDDGPVPSVVVSSPCSEAEVSISGSGMHEVELPLAAGPPEEVGGEECEVVVEPDFRLVGATGLETYSVSLEALAWGS